MEFMLILAIMSIGMAMVLPALAKTKMHYQLTTFELFGSCAFGILVLVDSILAIAAIRKVEVALKLQFSSIWTGKTVSQKIIREIARWIGVLGGSLMLATTAWLAFYPEAIHLPTTAECIRFGVMWMIAVLPVSALLYYGIVGARNLQDQLAVSFYRTANGLLKS
jgi:hypothetical protein